MDGFYYVFHLPRAKIVKHQIEFALNALKDDVRDADATRIRRGLKPRCDVDALTKDIICVDDNVPQVDTHSVANTARFRHVGFARRHRPLDRNGALDGVDDAREFHQHAVARGLDDPSVMVGDPGVDQLGPVGLLARNRAALVGLHEPRVAHHVSGQNCRQPPLFALRCHWSGFPSNRTPPLNLRAAAPAVYVKGLASSISDHLSPLMPRPMMVRCSAVNLTTPPRKPTLGCRLPVRTEERTNWTRAQNGKV